MILNFNSLFAKVSRAQGTVFGFSSYETCVLYLNKMNISLYIYWRNRTPCRGQYKCSALFFGYLVSSTFNWNYVIVIYVNWKFLYPNLVVFSLKKSFFVPRTHRFYPPPPLESYFFCQLLQQTCKKKNDFAQTLNTSI